MEETPEDGGLAGGGKSGFLKAAPDHTEEKSVRLVPEISGKDVFGDPDAPDAVFFHPIAPLAKAYEMRKLSYARVGCPDAALEAG